MKTDIAKELAEFFEETKLPQRRLCLASGVPASTICKLLRGKRSAVMTTTLDQLRDGMRKLREERGAA